MVFYPRFVTNLVDSFDGCSISMLPPLALTVIVKGDIIFFLAGRNSSSFLGEFNTIFNKLYIASENLASSLFSTILLLSNNAGPTSKEDCFAYSRCNQEWVN